MKKYGYIKPKIRMYDFSDDTQLLSGNGEGPGGKNPTPTVGGTGGGAKSSAFSTLYDEDGKEKGSEE